MLDDPEKTAWLISDLKAAIPIEVKLSPALIHTLEKEQPDQLIPPACSIVSIYYMGDEGGIMCALNIAGADAKAAHYVSITHLNFARHLPLHRRIESYQRHRIKKIKQQFGRGP